MPEPSEVAVIDGCTVEFDLTHRLLTVRGPVLTDSTSVEEFAMFCGTTLTAVDDYARGLVSKYNLPPDEVSDVWEDWRDELEDDVFDALDRAGVFELRRWLGWEPDAEDRSSTPVPLDQLRGIEGM